MNSIVRNYRHLSRCKCGISGVYKQFSTQVLTMPKTENEPKVESAKLNRIVNDIASLNLIEVSELSALLRKTLNLPDTPMMAISQSVASPKEEEEEAAPKSVKTSFTVKLLKFDDSKKVALIKEVKNLLEGMNLVQAKKFVESAPTVVKADLPKDEAEKLKESLSKVGAVCEIE
ncbi:39S ribosomal protein L12, mitochondrial [Ischnura elegans]|uniref:39S ribosomal protein L12, mitochondrial n=1 Tax=Ischnura elegans TaxID=197161 RepID=UPI001ED88140|nr:39S ribosomal protein L12, mitochondrial [Ischnura elegans]